MNALYKPQILFIFLIFYVLPITAGSTGSLSNTNPYPFSTDSTHLTRWNGERYVPFVIKGINLGVAVPGTFPGEMAATRAEYTQWLKDIKEAGFNTIRVYTLHFPRFYEVLDSFNVANPNNPIYLIQGVWLEDELTGYNNDLYFLSPYFVNEMRENVDCLHGNKTIASRLGKAYGTYNKDVSKWVMGYIMGREVSPDEILTTNTAHSSSNSYQGSYLSLGGVKASEVFATRSLDSLLIYEQQNYQTQRPVCFSSWPTLDPLKHPSEVGTQEDVASLDFSTMDYTKAKAGFFISYHAYPYYPDFVSRDSAYVNVTDDQGPNSYLGYLSALKSYYKNIPLLIAEFGVPSSWGVAHYAQSGMNHGGEDELEQGKDNVRLLQTILEANCAGGMQFAWIDEWFKNTWICDPFDFPIDNRVMWQNVCSAEQNFGLIGFKRGDFSLLPWETFSVTSPVKEIKAGIDYSYFRMQLPLRESFSNLDTLWVALDTYAASLGETKLITGQTIPTGAEFLLRITNDAADLFVTEAYDLYGDWHHVSAPEQLYHSIATSGKPWKLVRWKNNQANPDIQYIGHMQVNRLNLPPSSKDAVTFKNDTVNIKIPWTLLQFINPAYKEVMHDNRATTTVTEDTISDGISVSVLYKNQLMNTSTRFNWDSWNNFNNVVSYKKDSYIYEKDQLKTMPGIYVANTDDYQVNMNALNQVSAADGVLCNDLLIENDPAEVSVVSPPKHGFLSLATDGSFVYVPDVDFAGVDTFTYRAANAYQSSEPATVSLTVNANNSLIGLVRLSPNPAHDTVNIRSAGVMTELLIYDSKGAFVLQEALNETETQLNVSTFHAGLYLLRIKVGDEELVQKLIVK